MLELVKAIQTRDGLTDTEMGARLGVSSSLWCMVRNGNRRFSNNLALKAAGAFPELTAELLQLSRSSVKSVANHDDRAA